VIVTFADAVDYCLNYLAKDAKESPEAKRVVINAYRVLSNKRDWNYYKRFLRLNTNAQFIEGTVQYDALTNIMTLSGTLTGTVAGATNATPIQINSNNHGLSNGQVVTISGVLGNTAANGTFQVIVTDLNNFDLYTTGASPTPIAGNGNYVSGGTWTNTAGWPSWVLSGYFRLGLVNYYMTPASLIDSTHLTIDPATAPDIDIPAGSAYILMMDAYPLPVDFRSIFAMNWQAGTYNPEYVDPESFANLSTLVTGPGAPRFYTIFGDRSLLGIKDIRFYPAPDLVYPVNLYYNGAGRALQIEYYQTGTIATTIGSATITGTGTAWTQSMVGSVLRTWSGPANDPNGIPIYPTGYDGLYPFAEEFVVIAVNSATSITVETASEVPLSGANYRISDPVDCSESAMMNYFYAEIAYQARLSMRSKNISQEEQMSYRQSMQDAFEADSVYGGTRVANAGGSTPRRLREYPIQTGYPGST
jgi:hypothetical protein